MFVAVAQLNQTVGAFSANADRIIEAARKAAAQGARILLTPELSLAGYPPEDLLFRRSFVASSDRELERIRDATADLDIHILVGHPVLLQGQRFNAASVLHQGRITGSYHKLELPNYAVFDEERYFTPGSAPLVFAVDGIRFGVLICEDFWLPAAPRLARDAGAQALLVLNASPFHKDKQHQRLDVARTNISAMGLSMIAANLVGGQDELVFDGLSFALAADGSIAAQAAACHEDLLMVNIHAAGQAVDVVKMPVAAVQSIEQQIYQVLVLGVRDYIVKNGFPGALLGLSGGIDSALTLAIAVDALGAQKVRAVMMPSPYTAEISWIDSRDMAKRLGVRYDELSISPCFDAFRATLATEFAGLPEDTTEENIQARIRGTLLMALSNKLGSIVLTTGNKSEMAVGYCTLYGDMAGGFAVIKDIAKTMVYRLSRYRNTVSEVIPERIITRAPSAELRPDQKDQDSLPEYDVLDAIMQRYMEENESVETMVAAGFDEALVRRVIRLIRVNEYKRRQAPIGIRVTHRAFGRDWRYPITSGFRD